MRILAACLLLTDLSPTLSCDAVVVNLDLDVLLAVITFGLIVKLIWPVGRSRVSFAGILGLCSQSLEMAVRLSGFMLS